MANEHLTAESELRDKFGASSKRPAAPLCGLQGLFAPTDASLDFSEKESKKKRMYKTNRLVNKRVCVITETYCDSPGDSLYLNAPSPHRCKQMSESGLTFPTSISRSWTPIKLQNHLSEILKPALNTFEFLIPHIEESKKTKKLKVIRGIDAESLLNSYKWGRWIYVLKSNNPSQFDHLVVPICPPANPSQGRSADESTSANDPSRLDRVVQPTLHPANTSQGDSASESRSVPANNPSRLDPVVQPTLHPANTSQGDIASESLSLQANNPSRLDPVVQPTLHPANTSQGDSASESLSLQANNPSRLDPVVQPTNTSQGDSASESLSTSNYVDDIPLPTDHAATSTPICSDTDDSVVIIQEPQTFRTFDDTLSEASTLQYSKHDEVVPIITVGNTCYLSAALILLQSLPVFADLELVLCESNTVLGMVQHTVSLSSEKVQFADPVDRILAETVAKSVVSKLQMLDNHDIFVFHLSVDSVRESNTLQGAVLHAMVSFIPSTCTSPAVFRHVPDTMLIGCMVDPTHSDIGTAGKVTPSRRITLPTSSGQARYKLSSVVVFTSDHYIVYSVDKTHTSNQFIVYDNGKEDKISQQEMFARLEGDRVIPCGFVYKKVKESKRIPANQLTGKSSKKAKRNSSQAPVTTQVDSGATFQIISDLESKLGDIVGLKSLKLQLIQYANDLIVDTAQIVLGLSAGIKRPVMAFIGNPGTGKTSVAELVAELLHQCKLVNKPGLVTVQRPDLVGTHIGETAEKTLKVIKKARGSTLLVDEAYQLTPEDSPRDFGPEAVETIMKTIEGDAYTTDDRPAYIFAGYPREMKRFLDINACLRRRVTDYFHFTDYTHEELALILVKMAKKHGFTLNCPDNVISEAIESVFPTTTRSKCNAGLCMDLFQACKSFCNNRIVQYLKMGRTPQSLKSEMLTITSEDFKSACEKVHTKLDS